MAVELNFIVCKLHHACSCRSALLNAQKASVGFIRYRPLVYRFPTINLLKLLYADQLEQVGDASARQKIANCHCCHQKLLRCTTATMR